MRGISAALLLWYVMASVNGIMVELGPFTSQGACESAKYAYMTVGACYER